MNKTIGGNMREQIMWFGIIIGFFLGLMVGANAWAEESLSENTTKYVDLYNNVYTVDSVEVRLVSMVDYPQPKFKPVPKRELRPRASHVNNNRFVGRNDDIINMAVRG